MGDKSHIEWTDATWNPVTGCTKVSQGCRNCYALRDWARLSANPQTVYHGRAFTDVQTHLERLYQPIAWKKPRRIFVNSMSDLFHAAVSDEFIRQVFEVMLTATHHTYQILTKRPERMRSFLQGSSVPQHIHLGVSCEDQQTFDERLPHLLMTAGVKFVSLEPLLGPISMTGDRAYLERTPAPDDWPVTHLQWVIVGGESGPEARAMHPGWVRRLRNECETVGTPFFFKQWGEWLPAGANAVRDDVSLERVPVHEWGDGLQSFRVGKRAAGRIIDGRVHDGRPSTVNGDPR